MSETVKAPWTPEQVENLNGYQKFGVFHPFTCGGDHCGAILVATEDGWTCPANCGYTQDWAHGWMANGSWKKHQEAFDELRLMAEKRMAETAVIRFYSGENAAVVNARRNRMGETDLFAGFPEYDYGEHCPRHPSEIVQEVCGLMAVYYLAAATDPKTPRLYNVFTLNEIVLRTASNLVRNKALPGMDVEFVWIDKDDIEISLPLTMQGDTIAPWPDMMFETVFNLLFHGLPQMSPDVMEMLLKGREAISRQPATGLSGRQELPDDGQTYEEFHG